MVMVRAALTGTRIRERRTGLKLKQADLARSAGISPAYLNLIEHNRRRVSEAVLEALADALGLDPIALAEGASGALFDGLREAAAAEIAVGPALNAPQIDAPELDRIEEFVGRYPGWASLLVARQARVSALERAVEGFSERMAQDPYLTDTLHEVLSSVTSLRSTAAILDETEDIEPEWRTRFLRTIFEESLRLSRTAEALVGYLDTLDEAETGLSSPQEEVEAWLSARGYRFAEIEGAAGKGDLSSALTWNVPELATQAARELARRHIKVAQADAEALPEADLYAAIDQFGLDPLAIAQSVSCDLSIVFRRLAALTPTASSLPPIGFVVCDASGTLTFRKPVTGFSLPRFGAACPLWPLYDALAAPAQPMRHVVDVAGRVTQRFVTFSVGELRQPAGFAGPILRRAMMLIVPSHEASTTNIPVVEAGSSCRICPRTGCLARREPSIVQAG
jgi:transcriptional regulator with XRE-family HTH domain